MTIHDLFPDLGLKNRDVVFNTRLEEEKPIGWIKTLVGFANGRGGTMFVGVQNSDHRLLLMTSDESDKQALLFHNKTANLIEPGIQTHIEHIRVQSDKDRRYILKIVVSPSPNTPVLAKHGGDRIAYIRDYGLTRSTNPMELRELVLRNQAISYDSILTDEFYEEGRFTSLREEYERRNGKPLSDKILISKGFYGKNRILSKGGLLFADDNEDIRTLLTILRFSSISKGADEILNRININGSIVDCIGKAVSEVSKLTGDGIRKTDSGERDLFAYPTRALLEGIANAYAHRNYWMEGGKIQIDIYLDRIEITSPGSVVNGIRYVHEKSISSIIPQHRNPFIVKTLSMLGIIQGEGSGFGKIAEDYFPYDEAHQPFLNSNEDSTTLVLPNLLYAKGVVGEDNLFPDIVVEDDADLDAKQRKILSFCYMGERSIKEIADMLGVQVSSYLRNEVIRKLMRTGHLIAKEQSPLKVVSNHAKVRVV